MKGQLCEAVLVPCPLQSKIIETGVVIFVFYVKILSCYWSLRGKLVLMTLHIPLKFKIL